MKMRIRFGWLTLLGIALLLATLRMAGEEAEKQHISPLHVDHAPKLEDYLDENAILLGAKVTDFRQREPHDGAPASQETTAYISYDDRNLYIAFICKANPHTLRAHMVKREDIASDDSVSVSLDTFHDGQRAYE